MKLDNLIGVLTWVVPFGGLIPLVIIPRDMDPIKLSCFQLASWAALIVSLLAYRHKSLLKLWWVWITAPLIMLPPIVLFGLFHPRAKLPGLVIRLWASIIEMFK